MTGFSALNTAISGLNAAQRAIDTTTQNVANANTPGYSRQRVEQSSVGGNVSASTYTAETTTFIGGVQIDDVTRVKDPFLEATRVNAGAASANLDIRSSTLSGAEQLLNEPGDNGLQATFDDFYASWSAFQNPGDPVNASANGSIVLAKAQTVVNQLEFVSTGIDERWVNAGEQLKTAVNQLNQAASDLAAVNQKVREGTVANRPVNELLDKRDSLVRQIGELTGARAVASPDGTVNVIVGGITLVAGVQAQQFTITGAQQISDAGTNPPALMFGNIPVPVDGGKVAGLLASLGTDLPDMNTQLNGVAMALKDTVNTVHRQGFTLNGTAGDDFFSGTTAGDLAVIPTSGAQLAISANANTVDGNNALALSDLAIDSKAAAVLGTPGASVLLRNLAGNVGTKLQGLNSAAETQKTVLATADSAVEADSGVSIDEELTNLLMYQRAYQASARVITAADEMLDTLINHTGTVGR